MLSLDMTFLIFAHTLLSLTYFLIHFFSILNVEYVKWKCNLWVFNVMKKSFVWTTNLNVWVSFVENTEKLSQAPDLRSQPVRQKKYFRFFSLLNLVAFVYLLTLLTSLCRLSFTCDWWIAFLKNLFVISLINLFWRLTLM